jgi:hypothetical protein
MGLSVYKTSIEHSFLQSLGPFRITITGELLSGTIEPESTDISKSVVMGEIKYYGEKQATEAEQGKEKDNYP